MDLLVVKTRSGPRERVASHILIRKLPVSDQNYCLSSCIGSYHDVKSRLVMFSSPRDDFPTRNNLQEQETISIKL